VPAVPSQAHRLVLTAAEIALLAGICSIELPPGFATAGQVDESALEQAALALASRGIAVVDSDDPFVYLPVPSIAANLSVLAWPLAAVRVEVSVHGRGLRAFYAVSGPLGASLFARGDGGVELSMFPAETLGRELIRAVPRPDELITTEGRVGAALGDAAGEPLVGRLPPAALGEYDTARKLAGRDGPDGVPGSLGLSTAEVALAERVADRTTGTLWCLVTGSGGDGLLVGQVVWLATDHGWVGLHPDPDGSGRRMVVLQPVVREDIGVWLAPHLGQILEATSERS
jgi:hypothetical protein